MKPEDKGGEVALAVATTLLFGGYVVEKQVVGYDLHFAYLDIEKVDEGLSFQYYGKAFPPIEEQRKFFVDSLIAYLVKSFPLSTNYESAYKK